MTRHTLNFLGISLFGAAEDNGTSAVESAHESGTFMIGIAAFGSQRLARSIEIPDLAIQLLGPGQTFLGSGLYHLANRDFLDLIGGARYLLATVALAADESAQMRRKLPPRRQKAAAIAQPLLSRHGPPVEMRSVDMGQFVFADTWDQTNSANTLKITPTAADGNR